MSTCRLEDDGVVTTCGVPTFDPEPPVDFEFNEENHSKIIMKVLGAYIVSVVIIA